MELILAFLKSGTFRRWAIGIIGVLVLALSDKLGLGLDVTQQASIAGIIMALIAGSNYKEAAIAASAKVTTDAEAVNTLRGTGPV